VDQNAVTKMVESALKTYEFLCKLQGKRYHYGIKLKQTYFDRRKPVGLHKSWKRFQTFTLYVNQRFFKFMQIVFPLCSASD